MNVHNPNPGTATPVDLRELLAGGGNLAVDQLPMLPVIFDRVSSQLADRLRHLAWTPPHVTLNQVDSQRVGDVLDRYEMNAIAAIFHVAGWDSRVVIGFDRDFIFTIVELLFGGDGSEAPTEDQRVFSSIEVQIAQMLFEQVGQSLQAAFQPLTNVRFRIERTETRMDFASAGRRNMPAVAAHFLLTALSRGGDMCVLVPHPARLPMRQALSRIVPNDTPTHDSCWG